MQLQTEPSSRVEALREPHVDRTADLLAGAFEIDPAYRYLFPDRATRGAGLRDFFARNLRTHLPHACTWAAFDATGRSLATVTLRPPAVVLGASESVGNALIEELIRNRST